MNGKLRMPKKEEAVFYKENRWVLFDRGNGTVGIVPERASKSQEPIMTIEGSFEKATEAAAALESDGYFEQDLFDMGLLKKEGDEES